MGSLTRIARRTLLVAGLIGSMAVVPAHAGQGGSMHCNDGGGTGTEMPILSSPITLHLEVGTSPLYVQVCYSTTSFGSAAPSLAGGLVAVNDITTSPYLYCVPDPTAVVSVSCNRTDPDPLSPGYRITITVRFQETTVTVDAGVELGQPGAPACLRGVTVWGPTGQIGPFNIGVC